jgi:hypothetical protein
MRTTLLEKGYIHAALSPPCSFAHGYLLYLLYVCPISPVVFASSIFDQVCLQKISTESYIAYLTLASYITYPAFLESLPTQSGLLEQLAPVLPLQTSHRSLYF